jgi:anti-anti-sigma factor
MMNVAVDKRENRIVVHLDGSLDAETAPHLEQTVGPLLLAKGALPIVLDFSAVSSISSAGVHALRNLRRRSPMPIDGAMHQLRLVNVSSPVQHVLDVVGLDGQATAGFPAVTVPPGPDYRELVSRLRGFFPSPVSDPVRDAYFVQSVARGLDRIDEMKTERPYLGERTELDYERSRSKTLGMEMSTNEKAIAEIASYLEGIPIWGHPNTQDNVIPPSTIASIVAQMYGAIYNPNIIWDEYSHRVAEAEVETSAICASLIGYDPTKAAGVFTFGGTGTILYGAKLGIEKAQPGAFRDGVRPGLVIASSDASHYAKISIAGWLGVGTKSLLSIPTDLDNSMRLADLEETLTRVIKRGERIACIVATMGTTDAFGLDNLEYIARLRDHLVEEYKLDYRPHIHADAVIGWAWSVFNDYDFGTNPLGFAPDTLRSLWDTRQNLRHLHLADSVGLDFHKTGYGPYVSSLVLVRDKADLDLISRDPALMPYLFQFGNYHPGVYTLEASRSGGGLLAALANLKLFGKEGYRALLGHTVSMAEMLRGRLERFSNTVVVNDYNGGPVTLFRVYPEGVNAAAAYHDESRLAEHADQLARHNHYNRQVFDALSRQMERGEGFNLSFTESYRHTPAGAPILALKSFVMSPFVDEAAMERLVACLEQARAEVPAP